MARLKFGIFVLILLPLGLIGQTSCTQKKLIGTWVRTGLYIGDVNRDSLKPKLLDLLSRDTTGEKEWSWTFDSDGKRKSFPKVIKDVEYRLDDKGCRIIYGKRKNPTRKQITYIVYLDDKYLVLEIPNRHSHTIACFRRK